MPKGKLQSGRGITSIQPGKRGFAERGCVVDQPQHRRNSKPLTRNPKRCVCSFGASAFTIATSVWTQKFIRVNPAKSGGGNFGRITTLDLGLRTLDSGIRPHSNPCGGGQLQTGNPKPEIRSVRRRLAEGDQTLDFGPWALDSGEASRTESWLNDFFVL